MGRIGCSRVEFAFVESIDKKDPWLRGCPLDGTMVYLFFGFLQGSSVIKM